jgi:hypothetical protein
LVGGLVASLIAFLTDGFLHERLLSADWQAVYDGLRATPPQHGSHGLAYFALFDLGRGFSALVLYAALRSRFGPGPRTAVIAGAWAWFAMSLAGPAEFIPLGFYSNALWIKVAAYQLVTSILATLAGAALYKE